MAREAGWAQISLPSGEIRRIPSACRATIGATGNPDRMAIVWGKAGRRRWLGRKSHVRGTAMNPIDHPHGGGEGRTKGGRHPVSPTGKSAKGGMTRDRRKGIEQSNRPPPPQPALRRAEVGNEVRLSAISCQLSVECDSRLTAKLTAENLTWVVR